MSADAPATNVAPPRDRVRHIWFPLVVIAIAVAWWVRRTAATDYTTLYHLLVIFGTAAIVSLWFVRSGPGSKVVRTRIVWGLFAAVVGWFIIFKPVYNGDMGIWRWRARFAADDDELLDAMQAAGEITD